MNKKTNKIVEVLQEELQKKMSFKEGKLVFYSQDFTVGDLGKFLEVSPNSIVMFLMKEKKILVNRNQKVDFQIIESYLKSKNIEWDFKSKSEIINDFIDNHINVDKKDGEKERNFIVSVMGHIDHGKSTLLDSIMETSEQKKEYGGITQKVSFYPIKFGDKTVTFLDTPGHNLFIKMRERSTLSTDLVVLVVDANEGVKVQTVEVINHINKYKIPVIVFLNNKKKEEITEEALNSVMSRLQENSVVPSEWGGETIFISGRASDRKDSMKLLNTVYDLSDVYSWKANFNSDAVGILLDSYISSKEGIVNVILVKNGTMKKNDNIFTSKNFGKVKRILSFKKEELSKVEPGNIVQVFGLGFQSEAGENFFVTNDESLKKKIEKIVSNENNAKKIGSKTKEMFDNKNKESKVLNLVLLSNSHSSSEALEKLIGNISNSSVLANIVYSEVGEISEKIFDICKATESSIVLFNVKINSTKENEARKNKIKVLSDNVIYKIEEKINKLASSLKDKKMIEKVSGIAEVKKVFYSSSVNGNIAGCDVISGAVSRTNKVDIFREDKKISSDEVQGLQKNKSNVREAKKGQECGVVLNNFNEFLLGDRLIFYSLIEEEEND